MTDLPPRTWPRPDQPVTGVNGPHSAPTSPPSGMAAGPGRAGDGAPLGPAAALTPLGASDGHAPSPPGAPSPAAPTAPAPAGLAHTAPTPDDPGPDDPASAAAAPADPAQAPDPPLRALVIDDHPVVAEGWQRMIRLQRDCRVIAASSPLEGFRAWRREAPGLLVVDLAMGRTRLAGLRLIGRLRAAGARQPILVFTMHRSPLIARRAIEAGCDGIVMKDAPPDEICAALATVLAGGRHLPADLGHAIARIDRPGVSDRPRLSPREAQILRAIVSGLSYREIALRAGISYKTVANVSQTLKDKLGATSLADLIARGIRHLGDPLDGTPGAEG